jgi:hypothetical protein
MVPCSRDAFGKIVDNHAEQSYNTICCRSDLAMNINKPNELFIAWLAKSMREYVWGFRFKVALISLAWR